jgi:hypothetical protein
MLRKLKILLFVSVFSFFVFDLSAEMHHHALSQQKNFASSYEWEGRADEPFDELMVSWNVLRPEYGRYAIYVSIKTDEWSPWMLYAHWGAQSQRGYVEACDHFPVVVNLNSVTLQEGKTAGQFRVRIVAEDGASLKNFAALHVCSSVVANIHPKPFLDTVPSIALNVQGLSQQALPDPRHEVLCSPTSTTALIRFLQKSNALDPISFAEAVWDSEYNLFGNWTMNVAQAYAELKQGYYAYLAHLSGFADIYASLKEGIPVVISIRSPLPGSSGTYANGHLILVKGFDNDTREVLCMDPAFNTDGETDARYKLDDLMQAWERRKCTAYVVTRTAPSNNTR